MCGSLPLAKVTSFQEERAEGFSQPAGVHLLSNRSLVLLGLA